MKEAAFVYSQDLGCNPQKTLNHQPSSTIIDLILLNIAMLCNEVLSAKITYRQADLILHCIFEREVGTIVSFDDNDLLAEYSS